MNKVDVKKSAGYDSDFALWSAEQAALLRAGRFDRIDISNIAEEIESLGRSDRNQIIHRLEVLLAHLLKWQFQPNRRSQSWRATIIEQRMRIARLLRESPSLVNYPSTELASAYIIGLNSALTETGLPESALPATCPYSVDEVLSDDFWPEPAA